jgi:hypothetical protein
MTHILAITLVLQMHNLAGAPAAVVHQAEAELGRMYDSVGVHLDWDEAANRRASDPTIVRVVLLPYETGDLRYTPDTVLGAALRTARDTPLVYVFYRRVRAEAERYAVSTPLVLACAMAHELGHLLLPGRRHSRDGLMRACWSSDDFHRADQGLLRFSADEAALVRARSEAAVEDQSRNRARH